MAHFLVCSKTGDASNVAKLVFREIVRLHGHPVSIVPDHDVNFMSYFWKTLWKLCGTTLKFSPAFHPKTDGQTEIVNRSLGDLLKSVIGEKQDTWDLTLPLVEFAYNNAVNRSTSKNPFEIVHNYSPRTPSDLIPLPPDVRGSQPTSTFAQHIHDLHAEIRRKIAISNDSYKFQVDVRRRDISFEVGDFVMARIRPERLRKHSHKKLHA